MTSFPPAAGPVRTGPSRAGYAVAAGILAVGLLLTGFFVVKAVAARPSTPQVSGAGQQVAIDREGVTVYMSTLQSGAALRCRVTAADGTEVQLARPGATEELTIGGDTWYVVLRSTSPVPAGDYAATCAGGRPETRYALGSRASVVALVGWVFAAIGAFVGFGLVAGVIAIVLGLKRGKANRPPQNPGYPQNLGYPQNPGYPQQPPGPPPG